MKDAIKEEFLSLIKNGEPRTIAKKIILLEVRQILKQAASDLEKEENQARFEKKIKERNEMIRNLATRREALDMTQNQVAERLDTTQGIISRAENGENFKIARLMNKLFSELGG